MSEKKFDSKKIDILNNPKRLRDIPPVDIVNLLGIKQVNTIVDIGAGTGFFTIKFAEILGAERAYACDISDTMIEWMKENICGNYPYLIPIKTEKNIVPLEDKIADLCFMIALHHELEDPVSIFKECRRILRPEGKIFVVDWKKEEMEEGPPLHIRCRPDFVKKEMELVGFKNIFIFEEFPKHFLVGGER